MAQCLTTRGSTVLRFVGTQPGWLKRSVFRPVRSRFRGRLCRCSPVSTPAAGPGHPAFSPFWLYQVRQHNVFVSRVCGKMFQSGYRVFWGRGNGAHAKPRRTRRRGGAFGVGRRTKPPTDAVAFVLRPFAQGGADIPVCPQQRTIHPSLRVLRGFACGISTPSVMVHRRVPATGKRGPCLPSCTQPAVLLSASWSFREPARFARAYIPAYSFAAFNLSYA